MTPLSRLDDDSSAKIQKTHDACYITSSQISVLAVTYSTLVSTVISAFSAQSHRARRTHNGPHGATPTPPQRPTANAQAPRNRTRKRNLPGQFDYQLYTSETHCVYPSILSHLVLPICEKRQQRTHQHELLDTLQDTVGGCTGSKAVGEACYITASLGPRASCPQSRRGQVR